MVSVGGRNRKRKKKKRKQNNRLHILITEQMEWTAISIVINSAMETLLVGELRRQKKIKKFIVKILLPLY